MGLYIKSYSLPKSCCSRKRFTLSSVFKANLVKCLVSKFSEVFSEVFLSCFCIQSEFLALYIKSGSVKKLTEYTDRKFAT